MTIGDLLARTTSRELTEYELYFALVDDEAQFFHEHPHSTYDDYVEARALRDEHARRAGRADRTGEEDDTSDDVDDDDALDDDVLT